MEGYLTSQTSNYQSLDRTCISEVGGVGVVALSHVAGTTSLARLPLSPTSRLQRPRLLICLSSCHRSLQSCTFHPFALYLFQDHPLSFPSSTQPTERRRLCILPRSKHPACLPTSYSVLFNPATRSQPRHVSHELTTEEICALVQCSSRREQLFDSQRTFVGIGAMWLRTKPH